MKKILIFEDHPIYSKGLTSAISIQNQYTIVGIEERIDNFENVIKNTQPHIIILDINLAGKNSLNIIHKIKKEFPNIKILIVTMYHPDDLTIGINHKDFDGYLLKNSGTEILMNALEAIIANLMFWDPTIKNRRNIIQDKFIQRRKLTSREIEILSLIKEGFSNKQIAEKLFISPLTVKTHRNNLMEKMNASSIVELLKKSF